MVLQVKVSIMEQIKDTDKIKMISPVEWAENHLEAHVQLNSAISQFYWLLNSLIAEYNLLSNKVKEAEEKNFASFSKLEESIEWIRNWTQLLVNKIQELEEEINKWWKFFVRNYEWIVDTEKETTVELDTINDLVWNYLVNVVINDVIPNQWTMAYSFPKTSLAKWEYTPCINLKAKEWEHAVLEYNFTIILTQI